MSFEIVQMSRREAADVALERFLTAVDEFVLLQIVSVGRAEIAERTLVEFLAQVRSHNVRPQLGQCGRPGAAMCAYVRPKAAMRMSVPFELMLGHAAETALRTLENLPSAVAKFVAVQIATLMRLVVAIGALESHFSTMDLPVSAELAGLRRTEIAVRAFEFIGFWIGL